eukprot:TRINITY_DN4755_c0_g1_i1.p1 TRINITY_DN4755_c0_g1~~TRINITY_DN4755_c0_g1_i1.p1  ORF type:complete len:628 (+),score=123.08 TRINITY_DN4755_c0_g1_i1:1051-2934(+)
MKQVINLSLIFIFISLLTVKTNSQTFTIQNDTFVRDGYPFRVLSGSIHYHRIRPVYWRDRLERVKALGLNAVQVYVPWNFHEGDHGKFVFKGDRDLFSFFEIAQSLDLVVLLRPGPYICGEWDFGGLPSWLLAVPGIKLRTYDYQYISYVDNWWNILLPKIKPYLYSNGGPIVMVQIENEFGSYGNVAENSYDKRYMEYLIEKARGILGDDIVLYTTDGGNSGSMERGSFRGDAVYTVGDFGPGSDPSSSFNAMKQFNPQGKSPNFCSEYYTGWLTHWGENMANTSSAEVAEYLDKILSLDGNVNLYMAHGGTNFEFWSGANASPYKSTITSYDYNGPIAEDGSKNIGSDGVNKFDAIRDVLLKYSNHSTFPFPEVNPLAIFKHVRFSDQAVLLKSLNRISSSITQNTYLKSMEMLGQKFGMMLYTSKIPNSDKSGKNVLKFTEISDRVQVFIDGKYKCTVYRDDTNSFIQNITGVKKGSKIDFLLEAMGRVNFGQNVLTDPKGIFTPISWNGVELVNFDIATLPLTPQLSNLTYEKATPAENNPTFYRAYFDVPLPFDTYVNIGEWGKGIVWINGFNIGRYWNIGPQRNLYIPKDILSEGTNEMIILEIDKSPSSLQVTFDDKAIL